jgi:guanylate kinase
LKVPEPKLPAILVVISGPAGVGKTTVGEQLISRNPEIVRVVTATTRAPRGQEEDGRDYHFWDATAFQAAVKAGKMLEWAEVHGNCYGTPLASVVEALRDGLVVLLIIDVNGARQVKAIDSNALMVFLEPPEGHELERRLRSRATEDDDKIKRRLAAAQQELAAAHEYDARCINLKVEECVCQIEKLIGERRRKLASELGAEGEYPGLAQMAARLGTPARA